jgi:hypothetical protein
VLTVYSFVEESSPLTSATITATGPNGNLLSWTVNIDLQKALPGKLIHQLAAKALISELSDLEKKTPNDSTIRDKIVSFPAIFQC